MQQDFFLVFVGRSLYLALYQFQVLVKRFIPVFSKMLDGVFLYVTYRLPAVFLSLGQPLDKAVGETEYFYLMVGTSHYLTYNCIGQANQQVVGLEVPGHVVQFQFYFSFFAIEHQKNFQFDIPVFREHILQAFSQKHVIVNIALGIAMCLKHFHVNMSNNLFHNSFLQR